MTARDGAGAGPGHAAFEARLSQRRGANVPRPELHRAGVTTVTALALLGLGALGGAAVLVARPDGSIAQLDPSLLAGSPFRDFLVPGLLLGGVFGVGSIAVAVAGLRRMRIAPFLAFAIGCGQIIWIVVELAIIKEPSFLQPLLFGVGLLIAAGAVVWGRPTLAAWLAGR